MSTPIQSVKATVLYDSDDEPLEADVAAAKEFEELIIAVAKNPKETHRLEKRGDEKPFYTSIRRYFRSFAYMSDTDLH